MKNTLTFIFLALNLIAIAQSNNLENDKIQKRIQKRYISPQAKYISISGGWIFNNTHTKDPNHFFEPLTSVNNGIFPNITYEHGIKNNFFAEISYDFTKQNVSFKHKIDDKRNWSYSFNFASFDNEYFNSQKSHNLNIGGGYRIIGKNNFHFLNIHAGLFVGISNRSNRFMEDYLGNEFNLYRTDYNNNQNKDYQIITKIDNYSQFSFGSYLGLSTEFRLSDRIRFIIKYVHRFGFVPIFKGSLQVVENDKYFDHKSNFKYFGGGSMISGGLKILLSKEQ